MVLLKIGVAGWLVLASQTLVFLLLLILGIKMDRASTSLRACLSRSLRESKDLVTESDGSLNIARTCATRYRVAAARIENVDAYAICMSEVARSTVSSFAGRKWSYSKIDELLHGGPSFLVTLGLIGTFIGLMGNMVKLSDLVVNSGQVVQQTALMDGLAAVFPSMAAAFSTSLLGVSLSCILWLIGTINGTLNMKHEIIELLAAYLEQVVQADCRRYSLVGESMERMEQYLTEYLSQFSKKVSLSIEEAIQTNIGKLMITLSEQVLEVKAFVSQVSEGSVRIADAGLVLYKASKLLKESDFAERFSESCQGFLKGLNTFDESADNLLDATKNSSLSSQSLNKVIGSLTDTLTFTSESLIESDQKITSLAALNTQSLESLSAATHAVEGLQKRGMTWLSMRSKTDQQLVEINQQLQRVLMSIMEVSQRIAITKLNEVDQITSEVRNLTSNLNELTTLVNEQENTLKSLLEGLGKIQAAVPKGLWNDE